MNSSKTRSLFAIVLILLCTSSSARAQTLYWDVNGPDAGASMGGFGDGFWNSTDPNWTLDPTGESPTELWVPGADAVFSAGTDALDSIISVMGAHSVGSLTVQEGLVRFHGPPGSIQLGPNPARVDQGANLQLGSPPVISAAPGHVLTLDGGTLSSFIQGILSSLYPGNGSQIQLSSLGGTFHIPNGPNDAYSVMVYSGAVGMTPGTTSATLTKTGRGEFRPLMAATFTGLNVEEGLYRIHQTASEQGFGAPTGTVTVAGGAQPNTSNGAAIGSNLPLTGANASPATRSFVLSGVGNTLDSMFLLNAAWTINGPISGPGGLMINGWVRNDGVGALGAFGSQLVTLTLAGTNSYGGNTTINYGTLLATGGSAIPDSSSVLISTRSMWGTDGGETTTFNTAILRLNTSETIGSLAGGNALRGVVDINGAAVMLTTGGDDTSTVYNGSITGGGSLTKEGAGTFAMNGVKSYAGDTRVLDGVLSTNTASLADLSNVYLTSGSMLDLNFIGIDTIDGLFIDGLQRRGGIWGAPGSGAPHTTASISGTGFLQVTSVPEPGTLVVALIASAGLLTRRVTARAARR